MKAVVLTLALLGLTGCQSSESEPNWDSEEVSLEQACGSETLEDAPFKITDVAVYWRTTAGVEYQALPGAFDTGTVCDGDTRMTFGKTETYSARTGSWVGRG